MEELNLFQYGSCHSCDFVGYFGFKGVQEGYGPIPDFAIYNCGNCDTTLSLDKILEDLE